jgi:hypothetical protein
LDFPWLGKCGVLFLLDLYIYFGFPLARLKWSSLLELVRLPLQPVSPDIDELIMVQVKGTMTTSLSSPLSYFESMHPQVQDSKARSKIYYEKFDTVFVMIHKRNQ